MAKRILIQAGHVAPREPGFESGTGTTQEQEFTLALQRALQEVFGRDKRFSVIPMPGRITRGIEVDAALFLHGDGSVNSAASGYCFGYPDALANKRLADLIAAEYDKIPGHPPHRKDNYTRNLSGYYGFSRVSTMGPEVLIEHGFLTNTGERLWMFGNISKIAKAEYVAVCKYFGMTPLGVETPEQNKKRLAALRQWILKRKREGWSWPRIKRSPNWREFLRRGGK